MKQQLTGTQEKEFDRMQLQHVFSFGKHQPSRHDKNLKRMIKAIVPGAATWGCKRCEENNSPRCAKPWECKTCVIVRRKDLGSTKGGFIFEVSSERRMLLSAHEYAERIAERIGADVTIKSIKHFYGKRKKYLQIRFRRTIK